MSVLGRTWCVSLLGIDGSMVRVEAFLAQGLPYFQISGLPDTACRQSPDRVRAAAVQAGVPIPNRRLTVNLSPASLPKQGSGFDLPIAIATLVAAELVAAQPAGSVVHVGELGLDGSVRPVDGVLPMVLAAVRAGFRDVVVPMDNAAEAALVPGVRLVPVATLGELVQRYDALSHGRPAAEPKRPEAIERASRAEPDLADVVGQEEARFALEVAAAGGHHLFMTGPPGAGKTMLAERLPSVLPELDEEQSMQVSAIHSVLGVLAKDAALVTRPPFVAPHHGATMAAVIGGGSTRIRPGAISRAHHGVLFLDEAAEFRSPVLQALRQPVEQGSVTVARAASTVTYPARFQLVLAANPCPCGRAYGKGAGCSCSPQSVRQYRGRLAGPLLDRVDLQLQVAPVSRAALTRGCGEPSAAVAERVARARQVQASRLTETPWQLNADVPGRELRQGRMRLPAASRSDLDRSLERGSLTLRGYDRVCRLAWTIRDLAGGGVPTRADVSTALALRAQSPAAVA